ncbi:MAG: glutathione S-transferase family protein [Rhodobacteraceae bacterium]|nr:glutathione S-transferase family protein [Paracoccaceae bacterium]
MAKPIVTYFDFAGSRGEEVRLALTIAGIAFDDNRVDQATFARMKPDLPYGALPVLEIEGRGVLAQTNAILRLIGRQHGLFPTDAFEAARHDALMEAAEDLRHRISPTNRITDAAAKKVARQELAHGYVPDWGRRIDRQIGAGPFVGGAAPGVADIKLYMVDRWISSGSVDDIPADIFDGCKKLKAVAAGVRAHPAVQAWYARAS